MAAGGGMKKRRKAREWPVVVVGHSELSDLHCAGCEWSKDPKAKVIRVRQVLPRPRKEKR